MHVLYLVGTGEGGLPHYAAELANAVADEHEVTVMKPAKTEADGLFADDVEVLEPFRSIDVSMSKLYNRTVDPVAFLRGVWSYNNLRQVENVGADVLHEVTDLFPHVKFFVRYHGIDDAFPLVVTRHEVPMSRFPLSRPPVFIEEMVDTVIPDVRADRFVVHTGRQREALRRRGVDAGRIAVIPHGAYSVFGDHASVDDVPTENSLLFFGNLIRPKGVDTLVEAVPLVSQVVPDVTVTLAGDGEIPKRARRTIEENEEHFDVHDYFVPNDEVKSHFARSAVVVLPYRDRDGTKGHSGVLSTAFSFGKPVVASTAGEFPTLVGDSGCGVVVPPDDPERLAEAIVDVLTDDAAREQMAANSRRMADRLSWSSIAERHVELYRQVLDHPEPGRHVQVEAPVAP